MSKKKLLIFDMDGTIADTDLMLVLTWLDLYRRFTPKKKPRISEIMTFSGPPIRDSLKKEFPLVPIEETFDAFTVTSASYYEKYVTTYPFCLETLKEAKKRGYLLAVNTNKRTDLAYKALDVVGMNDIFDTVMGGGMVPPKPDPTGIFEILKMLQVKKEETLYIGDTEFDYQAAINAGVEVCLCTWGPRKLPANLTPEHSIDTYEHFFDKLGL